MHRDFFCIMKLLKKVIPSLGFPRSSSSCLEMPGFDIYDDSGVIHSDNYPEYLRTNTEYVWNIYMNNSNEIEVTLDDVHLDFDHDYLQIITGN